MPSCWRISVLRRAAYTTPATKKRTPIISVLSSAFMLAWHSATNSAYALQEVPDWQVRVW